VAAPRDSPEGVIKFRADHHYAPLPLGLHGRSVAAIDAWRTLLAQLGTVGADPRRYGGLGFGNLSVRTGPASEGDPFLITGTQTGKLEHVGIRDCCLVLRHDVLANRVESTGDILPSSESMSHAALYAVDPNIGAIVHGHVPVLWRRARELRLLSTPPDAEYGTVAMAEAMERLVRADRGHRLPLIVMTGHEDGVVAYGEDLDTAALTLIRAVARALRAG